MMYSPNKISEDLNKWILWFFLRVLIFLLFSNYLLLELVNIDKKNIPIILLILSIDIILAIWIGIDANKDPYGVLYYGWYQIKALWRLQIKGTFKPYQYQLGAMFSTTQLDMHRTFRIKKDKLRNGGHVRMKQKLPSICPRCKGKRTKPLTTLTDCTECKDGYQQFNIKGKEITWPTFPLPCTKCLNTGWIPVEPCKTCNGIGVIWKEQTLDLRIPPNSENKSIRLDSLGKFDIRTKDRGDLYLKLKRRYLDYIL